ncbi:MAG TPA: hypothetical protein EYP56_10735 [Planctomycetaceae bacterium]|nr:hypothetical protein [Planctomycetaceae bacterium]
MFGFASALRKRPRRSRPTRYRPIRFESLEGRYCPSAPTITAFQIDSVDHNTVTLSGHVADENPQTVLIDVDGVLFGTTYPDASGNFTVTGEAYSVGQISAVAMDEDFLYSDPVFVELTSDLPSITSVEVIYGHHTEVTIKGRVIDEDPDGLTVQFYGVLNGSTTTDENGDFSYYVESGYAELGDVPIYVEDVFGQGGSTTVTLTGDEPPSIINYQTQVDASGMLTVTGTVVDEDPVGLTVVITFLDMQEEVVTDEDGDFFWYYQMQQGEEGWVSAVAYDWWGLESDLVESYAVEAYGGS